MKIFYIIISTALPLRTLATPPLRTGTVESE
jgi:hypothetical protein